MAASDWRRSGGCGGRQIDQVAGMRYDRVQAGRFDLRAELANLRRGHLAAAPLVGVLAEDLKRLAADGRRRARPRAAARRPPTCEHRGGDSLPEAFLDDFAVGSDAHGHREQSRPGAPEVAGSSSPIAKRRSVNWTVAAPDGSTRLPRDGKSREPQQDLGGPGPRGRGRRAASIDSGCRVGAHRRRI